jgi:hypothetical protein
MRDPILSTKLAACAQTFARPPRIALVFRSFIKVVFSGEARMHSKVYFSKNSLSAVKSFSISAGSIAFHSAQPHKSEEGLFLEPPL